MSDTAEHQQLVADCEARESRLTEWEATFIDSIRRQLERGAGLTPRQDETLASIWEKATEKG
jgi:hypothetical protein